MVDSRFEEARSRALRSGRLLWVTLSAPWNESAAAGERGVFADPVLLSLVERFEHLKLDAAEHPELDHAAQTLLQLMGGGSGWPAHVFLDPKEGLALFGATALDAASLASLARQLLSAWALDPELMREDARARRDAAAARDAAQAAPAASGELSSSVEAWLTPLEQSLDFETGFVGRGTVHQFPGAYAALMASPGFEKWGLLALTSLARSTLCDVVEGGFFRSGGRLPEDPVETEKLAAENAAFLATLCRVPELRKHEFLWQVASELVDASRRDFDGARGWVGGSAAYYRLTPTDLLTALPAPQRPAASMFFGIESGSTVPMVATELPILSSFLKIPPVDLLHGLNEAKRNLVKFRRARADRLPARGESTRLSSALWTATRRMAQRLHGFDAADIRWQQPDAVATSPRVKWAERWAALETCALEIGQPATRSKSLTSLRALDELLLNDTRSLDSCRYDAPFLGTRLDVCDHLGASSVALALECLLVRRDIARGEGDSKSVGILTARLDDFGSQAERACRTFGLHASSTYAGLLRHVSF